MCSVCKLSITYSYCLLQSSPMMSFVFRLRLNIVHCTVYNVHCKLYIVQFYIVQGTSYIVHCTVYNSTLYSVQGTAYILQCTVYNCTMNSVQGTVYIVQCTLYSVHCTVYIVQCTLYSLCTLNSSQTVRYNVTVSLLTLSLKGKHFHLLNCKSMTFPVF